MWRCRDEVKFIKELAGNVTKFIGVERDHESTERLKDNLTRNLPDVDTQAIETDLRSWQGPDERVDIVLLFNILYYLNFNERPDLFLKLQQQWLIKGGLVAIVHCSKRIAPHELWKILRSPLLMWEDIEPDLHGAGFGKVHEYEMLTEYDHSDPDEYLLSFYRFLIGRDITLHELRDAIMAASPGKSKQTYCVGILKR